MDIIQGNFLNIICKICSVLFVVGAQALPQLLPHPALYHAPANCTTEYDTITTKNCLPKADRECEDVEVPQQKIELVDNCRVRIRKKS